MNSEIHSFRYVLLSFSHKPKSLLGVKIQGDEGSEKGKRDKTLVPMELQANRGDR